MHAIAVTRGVTLLLVELRQERRGGVRSFAAFPIHEPHLPSQTNLRHRERHELTAHDL